MKYIFIVLLIFATIVVKAQNLGYETYVINFEDTTQLSRITIDTIRNSNNIWQIGSPKKIVLSSAFSGYNVIITDTLYSYPVDDTSSFYITHIAQAGYELNYDVSIGGYYKIDSDTLKDYGTIEVSFDNGQEWIDLLSDTLTSYYAQCLNLVLSGRRDWTLFNINLYEGLTKNVSAGDTVIYRFSFISDSIQNDRDGLMYDYLWFADTYSGIDIDQLNNFYSSVYPNPGSESITIVFENELRKPHNVSIYSADGKIVYQKFNIITDQLEIDVSSFEGGIYFYNIISEDTMKVSSGKFVIK